MVSSRFSAAAWGVVAAPVVSSFLFVLFGKGDRVLSIGFYGCLFVGALIFVAARFRRNRPDRRRPTRIFLEQLTAHMRRDIGLDNL